MASCSVIASVKSNLLESGGSEESAVRAIVTPILAVAFGLCNKVLNNSRLWGLSNEPYMA